MTLSTPTREREVDDLPRTDTAYARLAAPFDKHHKDPRGLEYLTGNQVIGRLNDVLGPGAWTFSVKEHGYDEESDEVWVLGLLTAHLATDQLCGEVCREQFGSQKHNRRRAEAGKQGAILDYGFDLKGATTDALKKCATLIGVGLYMSEKDGGIPQDLPGLPVAPAGEKRPSMVISSKAPVTFLCVDCKKQVMAQTGQPITAGQADIIRDRFGALVCRECRPKKEASA